MLRRSALAALVVAGCGSSRDLDPERTKHLFREVVIGTAPGLSGLAAGDDGRLWTVSERGHEAYRVQLAEPAPVVETFRLAGVPADVDLEAMEVLDATRFAFGTEGRVAGTATVLLAELRGTELAITGTISLSSDQVGIVMAKNHGAEGVCGAGDSLVIAIEGAGTEHGKRWAPIVRVENGAFVRRHRLWLTSRFGKVSGLDCTIAPDGTVTAWAVERHFEVTHILAFTIGPDTTDITPRIALDLSAAIDSKRNLEGIAQLPDGTLVTVSDNQWKTIDGPSRLLVVAPGALK